MAKIIKQKDPAIKSSLEVILYSSFWAMIFHRIAHRIYKKNLFFLSNKHRLPLTTLLKQLAFIEKTDKNANEKVKI